MRFNPALFALETLSQSVIYVFVIAFVFSIFAWLIWRTLNPWKILEYYLAFGVPVGLLAFSSGFLTGLSRAPAVGSVMPAALALVGGLNIYAFGTETKYKVVIGYCVIVFVCLLFVGMEAGASQREGQREQSLIDLSQKEFRIRNVRKNLDLPPDMPSWIIDSAK
jgi:hypothetical protein